MGLENYCSNCGKRLLANENPCKKCNTKNNNYLKDDFYFFKPPVHNIGFFNFKINFEPYIKRNINYKYKICSCSYLNQINNKYCYNCGKKLSRAKFKIKLNPIDFKNGIYCDLGHFNLKNSKYCEVCGLKLGKNEDNYYSNFEREYDNSVFCSCGTENDKDYLYCKKCGMPLKEFFDYKGDFSILCLCSKVNSFEDKYCLDCGMPLKDIKKIICKCGTKNDLKSKVCSNCSRPLNPKNIISTKIICKCGNIDDFNTKYCSKCGRLIK